MAEYSVSELRSLRSALKRLLASEAKILKAMSKGDDTIKTETKYQEVISKKRETLNSLGEADYLKSKKSKDNSKSKPESKTSKLLKAGRGGGGGGGGKPTIDMGSHKVRLVKDLIGR